MKVREIVKITGGRLISGDPAKDIDLTRISTDTRTIKKGDLFIALSGPNFDGNSFVADALKKGSIGAIFTDYQPPVASRSKVLIHVRDTTRALQDIARYHRVRFSIPIIAVTGSNGKTTTKEMISAVLSGKYRVLKNEGTKNNHIGVPLTLFRLGRSHEVCVLEFGTNHKGEIKTLAGIARPTIAVITNIGPSHLEFLKDARGVFMEKMDVAKYLGIDGAMIINGDDRILNRIKSPKRRIIRYGFGRLNDIKAAVDSREACRIGFTVNHKHFDLKMAGIHNVYNALAAIAVGYYLDVEYGSIRKALADFSPPPMRMNIIKRGGLVIINDAYNSNPASMINALEAIRHYPARSRWVVSGDMLELGGNRIGFHEDIGERTASAGIEGLLTLGKLSKYTYRKARECGMDRKNLWHCSSHDEIAKILSKVVKKGDVVLVKGSRAMKMEKVIEKLKT